MHDISIIYYIIFALYGKLAGIPAGRFRSVFDEVCVFDHFGADEAFFKICMNYAGRLRGKHAFGDGPGTYFLFTGSEISGKI